MFKKLASAALMSLLIPAAALAGSSWTTKGVNFRTGPGTSYQVIGYLPVCAALRTYGYENGWVEVSWEGQRGWVSARYLADSNGHCGGGNGSGY